MARKSKSTEEGPYTNAAYVAKLKAKYDNKPQDRDGLRADWGWVDTGIVSRLLSAAGAMRGAVTMGVDRQGAGYTLAVFIGGTRIVSKWYRGDAEGLAALEQEMGDIADDLRAGD